MMTFDSMLMSALYFLVSSVLSIFGVILLLRAWMYRWALSPAHPLVQLTRRVTDWIVVPTSKVLHPVGNVDSASIVLSLGFAVLYMLLNRWLRFPVEGVNLLVVPFFTWVSWILSMLNWGLIFYVLLSWLNPSSPMTYTLAILLEPFLAPIRRVLPQFGSIDFSPVVVFLLVGVLSNFVMPLAYGRVIF